MKKVGDLFEELGFRKDASEGVKRAFVENLVKAAAQTAMPKADQTMAAVVTPPRSKPNAKPGTKTEVQLSFDFASLEDPSGPETPFPTTAKRNAG